jgi:retron-type reverse transcriptase
MPARQGQPQPMDPSRPRPRTRSQAAKRSRNRRLQALYDRLFRPDLLWRAWREVRAHGGRAGVDGDRREDIAQRGVEALLQALEQDLRAGSDRPQPGRRGSMPKPDGRQRPLGLPMACAYCISSPSRVGMIIVEAVRQSQANRV